MRDINNFPQQTHFVYFEKTNSSVNRTLVKIFNKPHGLLVKPFKKDKAMKNCKFMIVSAVCLMFLQAVGHADVKLPPVLSSHMVLQRGMKVPVWGTAAPGEKVTVKFRDQEKSTTADAQGKWKVSLDSLKEGGPDVLTVAGSNTLKLEDVLVGEVWLGSGQSNIFGGAGEYVKGDEVLAKMVAAGPYPKLRLIRLDSPAWTGWKEASPDNLMGFSAQLFSFGCPLQKELNLPVGLLVGAAAGKPSGFFLSEEAFKSDQACKDLVASQNYDEVVKKYEVAMEKWKKDVEKAKTEGVEENKLPKAPSKPMKVGSTWANVIVLSSAATKSSLKKLLRPVLTPNFARKSVTRPFGRRGRSNMKMPERSSSCSTRTKIFILWR